MPRIPMFRFKIIGNIFSNYCYFFVVRPSLYYIIHYRYDFIALRINNSYYAPIHSARLHKTYSYIFTISHKETNHIVIQNMYSMYNIVFHHRNHLPR